MCIYLQTFHVNLLESVGTYIHRVDYNVKTTKTINIEEIGGEYDEARHRY